MFDWVKRDRFVKNRKPVLSFILSTVENRVLFMSDLVLQSYLTFYLLLLFSTHTKNNASALGLNLYQSV